MSSMQTRFLISAFAAFAISPVYPVTAQDESGWLVLPGEEQPGDSPAATPTASPSPSQPSAEPLPQAYVPSTSAASPSSPTVTVPDAMVDASRGNIPAALQRWRMLRQGGNFTFSEYASFLLTYPGWPDADAMQRNAELMLDTNSYAPSQAVAFFDRFPPVTNAGRAKYAIALSASGRAAEAAPIARKAWRSGPLTTDLETRLLGLFSGQFSVADHDERMSALLWAGATADASRQLGYVSEARRQTFEARLAFAGGRDGGPGAPDAMQDAGYVAGKANYYRRSGQSWRARELLASRPPLVHRPADVEDWYEILLSNAQGAENDGQYRLAYDIASKVSDALPMGTDVSLEPLGVRDDYTSLTWLAGRTALEKLNQPAAAADMFEKYGRAARTPQTHTKGLYWAAKAARQAGDTAKATALLQEAAAYYDYFYGQLAMEALGRTLPPLSANPQTLAEIGKPTSSPLYMAASMASRYGSHRDQTLFLRAIANGAKSEQEHLSAIALSKYIGRPDLSVMAGRNARVEGHDDTIPWAYPTVSVPPGYERNFTLIHAIARQESQFDPEAISHAGARGLMQLMPGTARETAGKINLSYRPEALLGDPQYNIQLGSTYIDRMLAYYNYSYPLAVAAYNAGPGNVNKWLRANGDPRTPGVDILTWIENIPIYETKNYVQRVLENAVMYDLLNPDRARVKTSNPLSTYLGKRDPG